MKGTLIGFDLETTGTDAHNDRPVQACLVMKNSDGVWVLLNSRVNPGRPISPEATAVHGISDKDVLTAPHYSWVSWQIEWLLSHYQQDDTYLVTFNGSNYDLPMLQASRGAPLTLPKHIDVLRFARFYFPETKGANGGKTLGELYHIFVGTPLVHAHDAAYDVMATLELLEAMRVTAGVTLAQLAYEQLTPRPYPVMPFGKYAGTLLDEMPKSWAAFMAAKDLDPDMRATVDYILQR